MMSHLYVKMMQNNWKLVNDAELILFPYLKWYEFEFELITGQAAIADLFRGIAQVYNYKRSMIS